MIAAMKGLLTLFTLSILCLAAAASVRAQTCPVIKILGPAGTLTAGEEFRFSAQTVKGAVPSDLTYQWELSVGKVASGQGTSAIIFTPDLEAAGQNLTVRIKVASASTSCSGVTQETYGVGPFGDPSPIDEFGLLSPQDMIARIDNFFIQLNSSADKFKGHIWLRVKGDLSSRKQLRLLERILRAIRVRRYDASLVDFSIVASDTDRASLWIISSTASGPISGEARYFNGSDLMKDPTIALR